MDPYGCDGLSAYCTEGVCSDLEDVGDDGLPGGAYCMMDIMCPKTNKCDRSIRRCVECDDDSNMRKCDSWRNPNRYCNAGICEDPDVAMLEAKIATLEAKLVAPKLPEIQLQA